MIVKALLYSSRSSTHSPSYSVILSAQWLALDVTIPVLPESTRGVSKTCRHVFDIPCSLFSQSTVGVSSEFPTDSNWVQLDLSRAATDLHSGVGPLHLWTRQISQVIRCFIVDIQHSFSVVSQPGFSVVPVDLESALQTRLGPPSWSYRFFGVLPKQTRTDHRKGVQWKPTS